jgi:predicted AAA+ superfamily ATPase
MEKHKMIGFASLARKNKYSKGGESSKKMMPSKLEAALEAAKAIHEYKKSMKKKPSEHGPEHEMMEEDERPYSHEREDDYAHGGMVCPHCGRKG